MTNIRNSSRKEYSTYTLIKKQEVIGTSEQRRSRRMVVKIATITTDAVQVSGFHYKKCCSIRAPSRVCSCLVEMTGLSGMRGNALGGQNIWLWIRLS